MVPAEVQAIDFKFEEWAVKKIVNGINNNEAKKLAKDAAEEYGSGDLISALTKIDKAIDKKNDPSFRLFRAQILLDALSRGITLDGRANMASVLNDADAAIKAGLDIGYLVSGSALLSAGEPKKAIAKLTEYINGKSIKSPKDDISIWAFTIRAMCYVENGNPEAADLDAGKVINYYIDLSTSTKNAIEDDGSLTIAVYVRGIAAYYNDDFANAKKLFDLAEVFGLSANELGLYRGRMLSDQGLIDEAIKQFDKYIAAYPTLDIGYFELALCYAEKNDGDNSLKYIDRAISIAPDNPDYYDFRAALYYIRGETIKAEEDVKKCKQLGGKAENASKFSTSE